MVGLLISMVMRILASALGLLVASLVLDGFSVSAEGFVVTVLVFVAASALFEPFVLKLSLQYLPAVRGGVALVSTLVSLLVTATFTSGLSINGLDTWVMAPFIVWVSVVVAGIVLPLVVFKKLLAKHGGSEAKS